MREDLQVFWEKSFKSSSQISVIGLPRERFFIKNSQKLLSEVENSLDIYRDTSSQEILNILSIFYFFQEEFLNHLSRKNSNEMSLYYFWRRFSIEISSLDYMLRVIFIEMFLAIILRDAIKAVSLSMMYWEEFPSLSLSLSI